MPVAVLIGGSLGSRQERRQPGCNLPSCATGVALTRGKRLRLESLEQSKHRGGLGSHHQEAKHDTYFPCTVYTSVADQQDLRS